MRLNSSEVDNFISGEILEDKDKKILRFTLTGIHKSKAAKALYFRSRLIFFRGNKKTELPR